MPRAQQFIFWNPKTKYTRFHGASLVLLILTLAAALPACTSGNLCAEAYPCGGDWECLDDQGQPTANGMCGKRYATPLCNGHFCTLTCQGSEEFCPEPFTRCAQDTVVGSDKYVWICKANGIPPGLPVCSYSTPSDCDGTELIVWME